MNGMYQDFAQTMKLTLAFITLIAAPLSSLHAADTPYSPDWASISPKRVIKHTDSSDEALVKAVAALQPGDQLVIAAGTYSVERMWDIGVSGEPPPTPGLRLEGSRGDEKGNS